MMTAQIHQQIDHHLAGAMVSDFAATVGLDYRNGVGIKYMGDVCAQAECEHRRMFDDPELVVGIGSSVIGVGAHGIEASLIIFNAAPDDLWNGLHGDL